MQKTSAYPLLRQEIGFVGEDPDIRYSLPTGKGQSPGSGDLLQKKKKIAG